MNVAEDDREWVVEEGVWTEGRVINLLKTKRSLLYLKTQFVPRCKHVLSRL